MNEFKLETAIVFFIFNRPECTVRAFREIAKAKPARLFIISDGPRTTQEEWDILATRNIVKSINWKCDVIRNYSEVNMGCGARVKSGLQWVFSYVDEAIIVEDDIVPSQSFFRYCQDMLKYHRADENIFSIGGCNIGFTNGGDDSSYGYTKFMNMWGWATWKRAFERVDFTIDFWPSYKTSNIFRDRLGNDPQWIEYWENIFNLQYQGEIDTWDYQWVLSQLYNCGFSVFPSTNMIENIGFGETATHTKDVESEISNIIRHDIKFPLVHPGSIQISTEYEEHLKTAWCRIRKVTMRTKLKDSLTNFIEKSFLGPTRVLRDRLGLRRCQLESRFGRKN